MKARLAKTVKLKGETFGGIAYIHARDDFFAIDKPLFGGLKKFDREWKPVDKNLYDAVTLFAKIGILETRSPIISEEPYSGASFIGEFEEIPSVADPLVVNCFSTSFCALRCTYCHADDLMVKHQPLEKDEKLGNIVATARAVPSIVCVITGGDPLIRPERTKFLIENLAEYKSLVLDTSGVGAFDELLPVIKRHNVHLRISLDGLGALNDRTRIIGKDYRDTFGKSSSAHAISAIRKCVRNSVNFTVQSVISAANYNARDLQNFRDWLLQEGVKNWVLHIAVNAGKARKIEDRKKSNPRITGIVPDSEIGYKLWKLAAETIRLKLPIDIRFTDNNSTPNSVLLISSSGDLYTEGCAHNGKVKLYDSSTGRPDLVREKWHHIDRFGHARRYLNWNPWMEGGANLSTLTLGQSVSNALTDQRDDISASVEYEAKFSIADIDALLRELLRLGFVTQETIRERDEYYDDPDGKLSRSDYVIRLRSSDEDCKISLKGPRLYTDDSDYSRIELEVPSAPVSQVRAALISRGLQRTWFFEKKRRTFEKQNIKGYVVIDEIPKYGFYCELEGSPSFVKELQGKLGPFLGLKERRNYKEVFVQLSVNRGIKEEDILGAEF